MINLLSATETVNPILKWAGGKRWQLPHLAPLWAPYATRRLVEPFCGGMAVSLGLRPDRAVVNDVNAHLMNFYQQVQRGLVITIPMENIEATYYQHRDRFNALVKLGASDTAEAASLFYYLNRTGFNGLCRFNASGGFNVPFGKFTKINYRTEFSEYRDVFDAWTLLCGDFERVPVASGDFIYADPPYDVEFTTYSAGGFRWADQERLAAWLSLHDGPVVLVNQATDRIEQLYRGHGFDVTFLDAPRRISCTGDRTPAREILATRGFVSTNTETRES